MCAWRCLFVEEVEDHARLSYVAALVGRHELPKMEQITSPYQISSNYLKHHFSLCLFMYCTPNSAFEELFALFKSTNINGTS